MKIVILAGGSGTRLSEETDSKPKPMVEIGGKPILWHIMKIYSHYDFHDFIICLGYKGYQIKEYFANYFLHQSDVTIDLARNNVGVNSTSVEPWRVTLVDTGVNTQTGGRIKRIKKYLDSETFMMTYGDGVGNINIPELLQFHKQQGKLATVTSVMPAGRFGSLVMDEKNHVKEFQEKPRGDGSWINGGFFVLEPQVLDYIAGDETLFERDPLEKLAKDDQLVAYQHKDFWQPMDTLRQKRELEVLADSGKAPWILWEK